MSKEPELLLWGIDGDLSGNENTIQICFPFFKTPTGGIFGARGNDWNTKKLVEEFFSEEDALKKGVRLDFQGTVPISHSNVVLVMGPNYFSALNIIDPVLGADVSQGWNRAGNFLVQCQPAKDADSVLDIFFSTAKTRFDQEIATKKTATPLAENALRILRFTGYGDEEQRSIRHLLFLRLRKAIDQYRVVLELSAAQIGVIPRKLEQWTRSYFEILVEGVPFSTIMGYDENCEFFPSRKRHFFELYSNVKDVENGCSTSPKPVLAVAQRRPVQKKNPQEVILAHFLSVPSHEKTYPRLSFGKVISKSQKKEDEVAKDE